MKYALIVTNDAAPRVAAQLNPRVLAIAGSATQLLLAKAAFDALELTMNSIADNDDQALAQGEDMRSDIVPVFDNVIVGDQLAHSLIAFEKKPA